MVDYKCDNEKCDYKEEFYVGTNFKDEIPTSCPKCGSMISKTFPDTFHGGLDIVGGYDYQYGKKSYRKTMSPAQQAGYLCKGDDGKYADLY